MPLEPDERDDIRSIRQTLDEVVVPALLGDEKGNPGVLQRTKKLEDFREQTRGALLLLYALAGLMIIVIGWFVAR